MSQDEARVCPHCGQPMSKWEVPLNSTWCDDYHWVCFNDDCPYFVRGWKHMEESRGVKCSYRHMCGQHGRETGPLPVPHANIGKSMIKEEAAD